MVREVLLEKEKEVREHVCSKKGNREGRSPKALACPRNSKVESEAGVEGVKRAAGDSTEE